MNHLVKFGLDAYNKTLDESKLEKSADEIMRAELFEQLGIGENFNYKTYRRNKVAIFEIVEEVLEVVVGDGITTQFDGFVESRNLALGDQQLFHIEDRELFKVARIADGNSDLRRQKLDKGQLTVDTHTRGVKIYTELIHFLTGRINWASMVQRLYDSIMADKKVRIYDAIVKSFDDVTAEYKKAGAFDEVKLIELGTLVSAKAGVDGVMVMGTKMALSKITPTLVSDQMKDEYVRNGYFGMVAGMELREIPQTVVPGTDEFAISNDFLLVIPRGQERFVKMIDKGTIVVHEANNIEGDQSIDFLVEFEDGIAILHNGVWGVYELA